MNKLNKKLLKKIKPDMVFTFTIKPNIYGAWACKDLNIPCVANITGLGTAVENGGLIQKITVMLYKIAFKKVKTVFFQNQKQQALLFQARYKEGLPLLYAATFCLLNLKYHYQIQSCDDTFYDSFPL